MRAKFINEIFTEDSDPIKDLNIGYKNYDDYIDKKLKEQGDNRNEFDEWFYETMADSNTQQNLIEIMEEILTHTPLEYQIEYADDALGGWEEHKKDKER